MQRRTVCGIVAAGLGMLCGAAAAQPISASYDEPTLDRWMYPFNFSPGTKASALIFTTGLPDGFDDRDAQFIVGFDTGADVPTGLAAGSYSITSCVVRVFVETGEQFVFDPTVDSFVTYLEGTDPDYVADADAGRALELFGVGYRNGFDLASWEETTVFGGAPVVDPAQGARNAFSAQFDAGGAAEDVSDNVKLRFDPVVMAVGDVTGAGPGDLVGLDSEVVFSVDLSEPSHVAYLRAGLAAGRLNFAVTSLHPAQGGPGGGSGDPEYPVFYTRDNVLAQLFGLEPKLDIEVTIGNPADLNQDGFVNLADVQLFISSFVGGDALADMNGDGLLNLADVQLFLALFQGG